MISWPAEPAFHLYHREIFREDWTRWTRAFADYLPGTITALSVKTCTLPALLRDGRNLGAWAEVVSAAEYHYARHLGWPAAQIIVNGPVHEPDFLHLAWSEGALVQLDSLPAVEWLERQHPAATERWRCGIRCALTLAGQAPSRFGFSLEDGTAARVAARVRALPHAVLESLHLHLCTSARSANDYRRMAETLLELNQGLPGGPAPALNLGGGFVSPAPEEFRCQFPFPWTEMEDYAEAIAGAWRSACPPIPRLMLEPGLAVMARCLSFFTRVAEIKITAGRVLIICEGSCYNIKPSKSPRNFPLRIHPRGKGPRAEVHAADIVGYTCMEDDVLHRDFHGNLAVDDFLEFQHVGAYSLTLQPPFIRPAPPVYTRQDNGTWQLTLPAATWQEMMRLSCSPDNAP